MSIEAVVFDFFFTLADPTVHARTTVGELLASHDSAHLADEVWDAWVRPGRAGSVERPLDGEVPPFVAFRDHWAEAGAALLEGFGLHPDGVGWACARRDAHCRSVIYDDVAPTLAAIRERGLPIGVMSDADDDFLMPCIDAFGLSFDAVMSSEGLQCYKPHRSVFVAICDALHVAPNDAIYIGDTPRTDIVGARNAGLKTAWINRTGREWPIHLEPADFTLKSLRELLTRVL